MAKEKHTFYKVIKKKTEAQDIGRTSGRQKLAL